MSQNTKVAIIGAGASGLFSSILLSSKGYEVTIFEKNNKVGKKLLATGNGRCNITNQSIKLANFYSNSNISLIKGNLENFTYSYCKELFSNMGIEFKNGQNTRMYPLSLSSSSVVDILEYESIKEGTNIELNSEITDIQYSKNKYILNKSRK